jgi:hypothetical protein
MVDNGSRSRPTVIVAGIMVWYPLAGVTYQFLHYLLGLRRLGYDVYYLEDTLADVYRPDLGEFSSDATQNVEYARAALGRHGLGERWAYHRPDGSWAGMTNEEVKRLIARADAILNVTGAHRLREDHLSIPVRAYVESDPFALQVRIAKEEPEAIAFLDAHTHHFSFGENLGAPDCTVPVTRYKWHPTRQPVFMDSWCGPETGGNAYTTVTTWHNKGEGIEWGEDRYYWTKDREFRKFLDLPRRRTINMEMAVTVDESIRSLLRENGWKMADAVAVSRDPEHYRSYIQQSRAEFTVARDQYSRPRTGWFSDRSACYLAAGRPVITQETGFSAHVPTGRGLFAYSSMDGILAAVDAIESDYPGHCRAARELAAAYFGSDVVLSNLMRGAGL